MDYRQSKFQRQFVWGESLCIIDVVPYYHSSEEEKKQYGLTDGQFLVHLVRDDSSITFVVFIDENCTWNTSASKLLIDDPDLIEKIGFVIDDVYA